MRLLFLPCITLSLLLAGCAGDTRSPGEYLSRGQQAEEAGDFEGAMSSYSKAAELGNPEAQLELARIYEWGTFSDAHGMVRAQVEQDRGAAQKWYREAAAWYKPAAEEGDREAQVVLAGLYFDGKGVAQDQGKALELYRRAAEQGNAKAQYLFGYYSYWADERYEEALPWIREAALQGQAEAQYLLYVMHQRGYAVEKNFDEAVAWLKKAAEQNHSFASRDLNAMKNNGLL